MPATIVLGGQWGDEGKGKITDALERISRSLQENQRLERKMEADTASGRKVIIILGALALRDASTRRARIACWLASLAVFGWIVSVALTRQPLGVFAALG